MSKKTFIPCMNKQKHRGRSKTLPWPLVLLLLLMSPAASHGMAPLPLPAPATCKTSEQAALTSPNLACRALADAQLRIFVENLEQLPDGVRASRRLMVARNRTKNYSVPEEGSFDHCVAKLVSQNKNGTNGTNGTNGIFAQPCAGWHKTVSNIYKARELLRDEGSLNATFGGKNALFSMVSGAISAGRMNIEEYVIEEESYIQEWQQNITSARDTFIAVRGVSAGSLLIGGAICAGFGGACIISTIASQAVQVVDEIPTYITLAKISDLMNNGHKRTGFYLTRKDNQTTELLNFLRTMVAVNKTQVAPAVYAGEMIASYVSTQIALNATKTVSDVLSDFDDMLSDDKFDASVKTFAGIMFGGVDPPSMYKWSVPNTVVRALFLIGASWFVYDQIDAVKTYFRLYEEAVAEKTQFLNLHPGLDLTAADPRIPILEERIKAAHEAWNVAENKLPMTMKQIREMELHGRLEMFEEVVSEPEFVNNGINPTTSVIESTENVVRDSEVGEQGSSRSANTFSKEKLYKFKAPYDRITGIRQLGKLAISEKLKVLEPELERAKDAYSYRTKLHRRVQNTATIENARTQGWYKSSSWGMIGFAFAGTAVDAIITGLQVSDINGYIDDVVSRRTSTLETRAGILEAWQELHKPI